MVVVFSDRPFFYSYKNEEALSKMQIDIRNIDDIKAIEINDHTLAFYAGRDWTRIRDEPNWLDDGAMKLGIATHAIYKNDKAVIYDTFADIRQAKWVRNYLENVGIKQFTVVLSHWHLDHIAGNEVYKDCNIISNALTRELLFKNKTDIEMGCSDGPPEIKPLILPNITFENTINLYLDDLQLELLNIDIHSKDGTIIYIPNDKILLAGDTLEDSITYIDEPENLVKHVKNLQKLKQLSLLSILPNHGDPNVIKDGGYDKTLIDATINYITRMVSRAHDKDFLKSSMKSYLREEFEQGWIHYYEPYEEVHSENLIKVYDYYKNKQLPSFSEI
jgi:glyoxylase-like metal-dependent hydrolase (beta-lactamase superfamily II)